MLGGQLRVSQTNAAALQAECVICYEPLCESPVAVLRNRGRRACRHFFHRHCANACPMARGCPLCRAEYEEVAEMPQFSSPEVWFETMDVGNNRCLSSTEVFQAVVATVPVSCCDLEAMLPTLWAARGKRLEEPMRFADLFGERNGLLLELQESVRLMPGGPEPVAQRFSALCPDFISNKRAWFDHWDTDKSGVLEREEVVRGLAKSFRSDVPSRLCKKSLRMRFLVEEMWPLVDSDGNDEITIDEFCRPQGLADLILQNFTVKGSPREGRLSPRGDKSNKVKSPRQGATLRRSPKSSSFSTRRTWPEGCITVDDVPDDRPSLRNRPSLGFPIEPDEPQQGNATSSSGLPGASWSVLSRRKAASTEDLTQLEQSLQSEKSFHRVLSGHSSCSGSSLGSSVASSLQRAKHSSNLQTVLERPRSPRKTRSPRPLSPRGTRRRSKDSTVRQVGRNFCSDSPFDTI